MCYFHCQNPVSHDRTKHIDVKFHLVRDALSDVCIKLIYYSTEQMVAGMLTNLSHVTDLKLFGWRWDLRVYQCQANLNNRSIVGVN